MLVGCKEKKANSFYKPLFLFLSSYKDFFKVVNIHFIMLQDSSHSSSLELIPEAGYVA